TDLRRALGSEAERLRSPTPRTLALDLTGAAVDVAAFDAAIARGDEVSLTEAIALYRGPLLEGCAEEGVIEERESRQQAYRQAQDRLAARATEGGRERGSEGGRDLVGVAMDDSFGRSLLRSLPGDRPHAFGAPVSPAPEDTVTLLFTDIAGSTRL